MLPLEETIRFLSVLFLIIVHESTVMSKIAIKISGWLRLKVFGVLFLVKTHVFIKANTSSGKIVEYICCCISVVQK